MAIFVNRVSELAILNSFLQQVENGHGQAVGLVGEPGIGKSRLLAEFRRQVSDGRVTWVEGRCLSYGTAIPYLLVLDLLRSNCGVLDTDVASRRSSASSKYASDSLFAQRSGPK